MIWDLGGDEGWVSFALEQGQLDVRFYTLGDLGRFWIGCQRPSILHNSFIESRAVFVLQMPHAV
jgi:hypothetical protein